MLKTLTEQEYNATITEPLVELTQNDEPVADIWPYAKALVAEKLLPQHIYDQRLVEKAFRNNTKTFDHVLIPTDDDFGFVILIINIEKAAVQGHYLLDLTEEYGEDDAELL